MAIYKNPFLTRFADRTGLKNSSFLSMYAPEILRDILDNEDLLSSKASWIIGIPGSGKSSILRLFSIEILQEIIKNSRAYLHLYGPFVDSKVIVNDVIKTCGIYITIDELFAETANVEFEGIDPIKLFITLFNLRVAKQISLILKAIYTDNFQDDKKPVIKEIDSSRLPPTIFSQTLPLTDFDEKITEQEQLISRLLTSFPGSDIPDNLELHSHFSSFDLIDSQQDFHNIKFILMVDDAHELYDEQLQLLKTAVERRSSFPRWIATRKHIYPIQSLIGDTTGIIDGREVIVLDIDNILKKNRTLYRKFIKNLVERRLKITSGLSDFTSDQIEILLSEFDLTSIESSAPIFESQKEDFNKIVKRLIFPNVAGTEQFEKFDGFGCLEREMLLIKANRLANKRQPSLFPEFEIELIDTASKDKQAAELFLKKRGSIPLYSGFSNILEASNCNVEQFLRVFSPFVDRLIYRAELQKSLEIDSKEQNTILCNAANLYLKNMISKLLHGRLIYQLIDNLGRYFSYRTYEPNAPHAPGVTQFALNQSDMVLITAEGEGKFSDDVKELLKVLTIAISNNVIVPENPQHQGSKGSTQKYVFSLNRLLCIKYSLPLQKGDFQIFSLNFLAELCKGPFKPEDVKNRRHNRQMLLWRK